MMLNNNKKQKYTKEDIKFFDTISNFKKNGDQLEINVIENVNKLEEKYTNSDHNNFRHIIKNKDNKLNDHFSNNNFQKHEDSNYSKNDLKNFEKLDNKVYADEVNNEDSKEKFKTKVMSQTTYKENDLKNFNQIIKNEENYKKISMKVTNVSGRKYSKSKKEILNLKKIKILYFD